MMKEKVFSIVKKIPKGKVTTYKEIGVALDTKAYQAIGQVLAGNKYGFLDRGNIPCHRVVPSDGTIGGFCGHKCGRLVCQKKKLLEKEGIKFDNKNRIIDFKNRIFKF